MNAILCADEQILLAESRDKLQIMENQINVTGNKYKMKNCPNSKIYWNV
jgi:hypothetical protein